MYFRQFAELPCRGCNALLPIHETALQRLQSRRLRLTGSSDSSILGGNETRATIHPTRGGATTRYSLATNSSEAPRASRRRPREIPSSLQDDDNYPNKMARASCELART